MSLTPSNSSDNQIFKFIAHLYLKPLDLFHFSFTPTFSHPLVRNEELRDQERLSLLWKIRCETPFQPTLDTAHHSRPTLDGPGVGVTVGVPHEAWGAARAGAKPSEPLQTRDGLPMPGRERELHLSYGPLQDEDDGELPWGTLDMASPSHYPPTTTTTPQSHHPTTPSPPTAHRPPPTTHQVPSTPKRPRGSPRQRTGLTTAKTREATVQASGTLGKASGVMGMATSRARSTMAGSQSMPLRPGAHLQTSCLSVTLLPTGLGEQKGDHSTTMTHQQRPTTYHPPPTTRHPPPATHHQRSARRELPGKCGRQQRVGEARGEQP